MNSEGVQRLSLAGDFRVGDWLVEPSLDRLSRNGTVLHLRPQLTDMLVLLARNAGRTVRKDEILAEVWGGQFVAESGMTRCIAEIRQALGDDAHDPKILQTITKRGYRLVAEVAFLDTLAPPPEPPTVPVSAEPAAAVLHADPSGARVAGQEVDAFQLPGDRQAPDRPMAGLAVAPARLGWHLPRAATRTLLSAVGVAPLVVLVWGAAGGYRAPVLSGRESVLLADVVNTTGDSAFDQTLRLALAVHLGQAPFLHILPASQSRAGLAMMGRSPDQAVTGAVALELCRREGAAVLLSGSVAKVGSHYAVGLEAIACASGESVARELVEVGSKDAVLGALGTAAKRLRGSLGESRESLSRYDVPIVQATTPSLEALKSLSHGDMARDRSRPDEALMFYRRATELDPSFAAAWARRGAAAQNLAWSVGNSGLAMSEEAKRCFGKAYELRDRVSEPERLYILGHYYRFVAGDPDKTVDTYEAWKKTYPGSLVPLTNLASFNIDVFGRYDAALPDALQAVALAPSSSIAHGTLVLSYLGMNRVAEARQAMRAAASQGAQALTWHRQAFDLAVLGNDRAAMEEEIRFAAGNPTIASVMSEGRALAAASAGRLREARRLWSEAMRGADPLTEAAMLLQLAEAEALLGDARAARRAADSALALDGSGAAVLSAAGIFALAGDAAGARRLLNQAARQSVGDPLATTVWQATIRAMVEAGAGRPELARQVLDPVRRFERGAVFGMVPLGTRAWIEEASGRPAEAAAAYRDILSLRAVLPTSPWMTFARLRLARALRDSGDAAASRAAYDAVIEWMKEADQDAPVLVLARRERAALPNS